MVTEAQIIRDGWLYWHVSPYQAIEANRTALENRNRLHDLIGLQLREMIREGAAHD